MRKPPRQRPSTQSDVLAPTSTVREALTFAANLRLAENVPEEVKRERVYEVMSQLGLMDVADTRIGDGERRGISGGEARRVSIGIELIAAPEILILDEPTSVSIEEFARWGDTITEHRLFRRVLIPSPLRR